MHPGSFWRKNSCTTCSLAVHLCSFLLHNHELNVACLDFHNMGPWSDLEASHGGHAQCWAGGFIFFSKFCLITTFFLLFRPNEGIIWQLSSTIWIVVRDGISCAGWSRHCNVLYCIIAVAVVGRTKVFGENFSRASSVRAGHCLFLRLCAAVLHKVWLCCHFHPINAAPGIGFLFFL